MRRRVEPGQVREQRVLDRIGQVGTVGVFMNEGFTPRRISVRGINRVMSSMTRIDDAIGFTFAENGHVLPPALPGRRPDLRLTIVTGTWHERTYLFREMGTTHRWRGMYPTQAFGSLIFGDNSANSVHASDQFYYQNDDPQGSGVNYIRSVKTTPIGSSPGASFATCRFSRYSRKARVYPSTRRKASA